MIIIDYRRGVDFTDQMHSVTTRRTIKWWKKAYCRLVDICLLNAWIIYKSTYPESKITSNRMFCLKVVEDLVQPLLTLHSSLTCPPHLCTKGRQPVSVKARLIEKHSPYKNMKRQHCVLCSQAQSSTTKKKSDKKNNNTELLSQV